MNKYVVRPTDEECKPWEDTIDRLKGGSQKACRVGRPLQVDANAQGWTDRQVAEDFRRRVQTVERIRRHCVLESFELALCGKQSSGPAAPKLLDGEREARVIVLRLSSPPVGFANLSLRPLERQVVELWIVASISHETVRQTLNGNGITGSKVLTG